MIAGKRELLAGVLDRSGSTRWLARRGGWRGLLVLNYHRIGDPSATEFDRGVFSATDDGFADQVRFLTQHFDLITPCDLDHVLREKRGRCVMITFDDGYRDNYEAAFPILRAYGAKAVFFITTGFLDDHLVAWWDEIAWMVRSSERDFLPRGKWTDAAIDLEGDARERAIHALLRTFKQLSTDETPEFLDWLSEATGCGRVPRTEATAPWMTWDMVREMQAGGMEIGGHTVTHPVLSRLPADEQHREVRRSKERIEAETGQPSKAFSYPVGQPDSF
ncbi:MAG: polysaccharide deacetylase, partial [Planctomycetota bacterium]